ncbi:tyrosine-type recombinase/integrase [Streptomyces mirabilis]|uniref:Phage integrase family protein n=1 Tax=Streptomyces mirabilis TaxID=68239 RepID=A0A1I2XJ16_9ACTN|nr:tyrosine-type recombinase/integrase [Streptomyces mirabilis]SFH13029.1 Phage integrase family protein [Streptomyces mirabilis]
MAGRDSLLVPCQRANVPGNLPLADGVHRRMLGRQWRHTFACRLINRDVPQQVVRVLLDHGSHKMTSHYAKITDQTV